MRKILSVDKSENYTICLFGHRLLEMCDHYLISFSLDSFPLFHENYIDESLVEESITEHNLHYLNKISFNYATMQKYIASASDLTEGFVYFSKDTHEPVGCIWLMYRGGNEAQYRIRTIDAFGFYFYVFPAFRGKRYIEYFIFRMLKHLEKKGINKLYASVRKNNKRALHAYQRAGMKIEASKRFFRFISWRLPYPVI